MKAQHEGALPPPCIVRKDPRVPHTARRHPAFCLSSHLLGPHLPGSPQQRLGWIWYQIGPVSVPAPGSSLYQLGFHWQQTPPSVHLDRQCIPGLLGPKQTEDYTPVTREPGCAPPRHAHGDLTSLAPHESRCSPRVRPVCRGTCEGASRVPIPFRTSRRNVGLLLRRCRGISGEPDQRHRG